VVDFNAQGDAMESFGIRLANLERAYGEISKRLDSIGHHFDGVERRIDGVEQRLTQLDAKVDGLNQSLSGRIDRLTVAGFAGWMTVMLAIFFRH
jgi:DNA anti-recombination protein RmuC